jgi:alanine-glyoxylate transaminase/serine-glyoxylate transaminase/serine-pyruvate transaminase
MLFALRKGLDLLLEEGLEHVFERHRLLAEAVRRAVGAWRAGGAVDFNVPTPNQRANSVTTIRVAEGVDPLRLVEYCDRICGVILGKGIGDLTGKAFRIAHMGHVNAPMTFGTLCSLETGLAALSIPHGHGGAQAAVDYLGSALAA